jgi:hypothetical protein
MGRQIFWNVTLPPHFISQLDADRFEASNLGELRGKDCETETETIYPTHGGNFRKSIMLFIG